MAGHEQQIAVGQHPQIVATGARILPLDLALGRHQEDLALAVVRTGHRMRLALLDGQGGRIRFFGEAEMASVNDEISSRVFMGGFRVLCKPLSARMSGVSRGVRAASQGLNSGVSFYPAIQGRPSNRPGGNVGASKSCARWHARARICGTSICSYNETRSVTKEPVHERT